MQEDNVQKSLGCLQYSSAHKDQNSSSDLSKFAPIFMI